MVVSFWFVLIVLVLQLIMIEQLRYNFNKLLVFCAICFAANGSSFAQGFMSSDTRSFAIGEELTYIMSYTWFFIWTDVGEVQFKVQSDTLNNQQVLHLHAYGTSYPFYDWFFKVRDVYESWVDADLLIPLRFNRDVNEGGYTKENEYSFCWDNNEVKARIRRRGGENKFYTIPVQPGTVDVVTAIYISRNLDFSEANPMDSYPVSVILDREIFSVKYTYLAKEVKKVKGLGEFNTLKFRVELIAGDVFKEGQYLYVWVSNDPNRVPLYIESPIRVGSVKARLGSYKGLQHRLNEVL